jgi:phosphatidylglycerol phospholipase C
MGAFQGAVDVGAHALETDVHLSADGVVVLSHDPSLKRCFGVDKKISDCSWDYLSTLQTVAEPKQGLPRLRDLLAWLNKPGMESIWVLLDIKIDDEAEDLIGAIADTFEQVQGVKPWDQRVILGCWNVSALLSSP